MLANRLRAFLSEFSRKTVIFLKSVLRMLEPIISRLRSSADRSANRSDFSKPNSGLAANQIPKQIIEIEASDTPANAIGKIDSSGLEIAFIKVPEDAYEFERLDYWLRITAYARRTGFVPIVITRNSIIRRSAKASGLEARTIPLSGFMPIVALLLTRLKGRSIRSVSSSTLLALTGVLVLGIASLWGLSAIQRAEIRLNPPTTLRTIDTILTVTDLASGNDIVNRKIVGIPVRTEVSATVVVKTTGIDDSGAETALVVLEFTNTSTKPYSLAKGFEVRTEEYMSFAIIEDILLKSGDTVLVSALCNIPGEIGNVAADSLVVGTLPREITVTNPEPAFGGTDTFWPIVSPDDVLQAHIHGQSVLRTRGIHELRQLKLGELVSTTVATPIFSQQARQAIGDPSDIFVMDYVIIATGLVVSPEEARNITRSIFSTTLSPTEELVAISQIEVIDSPELGKDKIRIRASAEITDLTDWIGDVTDFLPGLDINEAESFLKTRLELDQPPDVSITPSFLRRTALPNDPKKITLILQ